MKKILFFVFLVTVVSFSRGADKICPELSQVILDLKPVLKDLTPAPEFKTNGTTSVTISYKSRMFKVHGSSMTGEYSKKARDELGPSCGGFVLRMSIQPKGRVNQAFTPQTSRGPYWKTYLQVTTLYRSDKQLYWGLSYGSRVDQKLLTAIRQKIERKLTEPIPEMDLLINAIHKDLKALSKKYSWLSAYEDKCLLVWEGEGRAIFFSPRELIPSGVQQPDQILIGYGYIYAKKGLKSSNDVEGEEVCCFPFLDSKIYAHLLIRGEQYAELKKEIAQCIIKRCEALQQALENGANL